MKNGLIPETKEEFITLLNTYNVFVERALVALFERQTIEEKVMRETVENNGVGFTGVDGEIFSSFAQRVIDLERKGVPAGRRLSPKQLEICRKLDKRGTHKLGKYWKQIESIMQEKAAKKAAAAAAAAYEGPSEIAPEYDNAVAA